MFKNGDRIRMIHMPDDPDPIPAGTTGTITNVNPVNLAGDKFTQYSVKWDNGRRLSACVPPDILVAE